MPAEPESEAAHAAPPVEAPPAAPPAETEDETLMTSLEAALVAEEASAAARSTMAQSSVQKLAAAERLRAEADAEGKPVRAVHHEEAGKVGEDHKNSEPKYSEI